MEIKSPCNKICKLENNICVGCKRTINEIASWIKMTNEEKLAVLERISKDNLIIN